MTSRYKFAFIVLLLAAIFLWPFVGFVYNVGDRETGAGWDIFMKSSPSFQFRFSNPARDGLGPDVVPFDQLDDARKERGVIAKSVMESTTWQNVIDEWSCSGWAFLRKKMTNMQWTSTSRLIAD